MSQSIKESKRPAYLLRANSRRTLLRTQTTEKSRTAMASTHFDTNSLTTIVQMETTRNEKNDEERTHDLNAAKEEPPFGQQETFSIEPRPTLRQM